MNVGGIDYSKYNTWKPYQTSDGNVYYEVPNSPGWLFDPFTSSQTKKVQLYSKQTLEQRQAAIAQQQQQTELQNEAQKNAIAQSKPGAQALSALMPIGGLLAGKYAVDNWLSPVAGAAKTPASGGFVSGLQNMLGFGGGEAVAAPVASAATSSALPAAAGLENGLLNYGASYGASAPLSLGVDTSLSGVGATAAAPESTGLLGIGGGGLLPAAGIAGGAYLGYQGIKGLGNVFKGKKMSTPQQIALALPTFGASFLWNGLRHVSTKETEQKRWGKLADKGITGAQEAFLAAHSPESDGVWHDNGIGSGKEWNWEDAVARAKANPAEFRGAYGNFETFGNDWSTYSPQQQDAIVSQLINENLYDPDKGDITISDKERARQIKDQVLNPSVQNPLVKAPPTPPVQTLPQSSGLPVYFKNAPQPVAPANSPVLPPPPPPKAAVVLDGKNVGKNIGSFNSKFGERS